MAKRIRLLVFSPLLTSKIFCFKPLKLRNISRRKKNTIFTYDECVLDEYLIEEFLMFRITMLILFTIFL